TTSGSSAPTWTTGRRYASRSTRACLRRSASRWPRRRTTCRAPSITKNCWTWRPGRNRQSRLARRRWKSNPSRLRQFSAGLGGGAIVGVSAEAVALAKGAIPAMFFSKLRAVTFSLLPAVLASGGGLLTYHFVASGSQAAAKPAAVHEKMIGDLINKLGDDDFKTRQAAVKRLVSL